MRRNLQTNILIAYGGEASLPEELGQGLGDRGWEPWLGVLQKFNVNVSGELMETCPGAKGWISGLGSLRKLQFLCALYPLHWRSCGPSSHLTGRKSAVGIKAEDDIGADVTVWEESVTGLWWGRAS